MNFVRYVNATNIYMDNLFPFFYLILKGPAFHNKRILIPLFEEEEDSCSQAASI